MKTLGLLLTGLLLSVFVSAHDVHLTTTSIDYNTGNGNLEITIDIQANDLEKALEEQTDEKVHLGEKNEIGNADQLIFNYIKQNFAVHINGQELDMKFIGKELSEDYHDFNLYIECKNVPAPENISNIKVMNKFLTEIHNDQSNTVSIFLSKTMKFRMQFNKIKTEDEVSMYSPPEE